VIKWVILFFTGLFAAGCVTSEDSPQDPVIVHDTVRVVQKKTDTIKIHDTIKTTQIKIDTIKIRDTVKTIDTIRTVANVSDTSDIFSVWHGVSGGKNIVISFTEDDLWPFEFTGNSGTTAFYGYCSAISNGQASITFAGYKATTWIMSLSGGKLTIDEVGEKLFPSSPIILTNR
jgi:hypothetical protein